MFGISRRELKIFLEQSLSEREKRLLLECYKLQGCTFSFAVRKLANNGHPTSTIKLVLKRLKSLNLVEFGDIRNRGIPIFFTHLGEVFIQILRGESND